MLHVRVLRTGRALTLAGVVVLVSACQSQQQPSITVTVAPTAGAAASPAKPATTAASPVAAGSPAAAASSVASPAAAPAVSPAASPAASPVALPAASASPAASPAARSGAAPKSQYQMDAQHTGRSPFPGPTNPVLLRTFDTLSPGGPIDQPGDPRPDIQSSAALGADGTIYIGNFQGALEALRDPGSGQSLELLWRFHPAGASSFHTTPALAPDGTVYAGFSTGGATPEAHGTFYALRPAAGSIEPHIVWQVDLGPGRQTASPTLGPDGTIYVVSGAGLLHAIDPNGAVKWTVKTGPNVKAAPALAPGGGAIYLASLDDHLYAVTPPAAGGSAASVAWTFAFGDHPGSQNPVTDPNAPFPGANGKGSGASPTVAPDGTIYLGAANSVFYAVAPDGQMKWLFEAQPEVAGIWSAAALSPDAATVYFGANKGGVYALNARDGSLRWRYDIVGSVYSSPTLDSQGRLYTGSTVGHVFGIDTGTGKAIFDYDATAPVWTAPALRADGSLVIGTLKGQVQVLGNR